MRILAVGGGSGGHVTPVAAVLKAIGAKHPRAELRFWTDKKFGGQARLILSSRQVSAKTSTIISGKLRRYHHLSVLQHLLWPRLIMLNLRDAFLVLIGFFESLFKLIIWRPNVIFMKGGYVCLPVGLAAKLLGIRFVLHDSDAHPGLTNRVLAKWASHIATGAPLEYYDYPKDKATYVGIPISEDFHPLSTEEKYRVRQEWGINPDRPLVVVTGGGLGARAVNEVVAKALDDLNKFCSVILISGAGHYDEMKALTPPHSPDFKLHAFVTDGVADLLGSADLVVARAGATTILELAALSMPTILVPNAKLTGGHQLKNAAVYRDVGAVDVVDEEEMVKDPSLLVKHVKDILDSPKRAFEMASVFARFSRPKAAAQMAEIVLTAAKK